MAFALDIIKSDKCLFQKSYTFVYREDGLFS